MGCVEGKINKKLNDGLDGAAKVYVNNSIRPICVLRLEVNDNSGENNENVKKKQLADNGLPVVTAKKNNKNSPFSKQDSIVADKYRFVNVVGKGRFSCVWLVESRMTKHPYALKMTTGSDGKDIFNSELSVLSRVRHSNIVQMIETFEKEDRYYTVFELATGGDLFDRIESQPDAHFVESSAIKIVNMIVDALRYLHNIFITHRDLKMDNVLFYHPGPDSKILLTDFSVAHVRKSNESKFMTTTCGTPEYMAPEILLRKPYTSAVDMWSLGVIVYCILSGSFPFKSSDDHLENSNKICPTLAINIIKGNYSFSNKMWENVGEHGLDFIRKLLTVNQEERLTATDALRHPWFKKCSSNSSSSSSDISDDSSSAATAMTVGKSRHKRSLDPELSKFKQQIINHRNARM
ncbi:Serine/threonine-protein kinase H1 [Chamberlinius hualienensis]